MKIKILYDDKDILAIEKPSGVLVDDISKKYPKFILAHRLDKETSGVMLLAKNKKAHEFLKEQFSASAIELKTKGGLADKKARIKKAYVAIVNGFVKNDHGIINKPIGRSPKDFRRHLAGRGARGKLREAVTEYRVLKRFTLPAPSLRREGNIQQSRPAKGEWLKADGVKFSFLEIRPKTGRTHQIRVHMKYLNHPVACDSLYNPSGPCPKGLKRMALHALSIEFTNLKGEKIKVESKLPKEFAKILI